MLANLFLHYVFDVWLDRGFSGVPFERYADDIICHCRSEREALKLRQVLEQRFAECGLVATPPARLWAGKPRKDESLFALTRLRACDEVGRPKNTIPSSWSLTSWQEVMGHFKLQAYGPQQSLRRMIWVDPYQRGPDDAPIRPQGHRI